jgi:indole-3-glycerol phosphate synthase
LHKAGSSYLEKKLKMKIATTNTILDKIIQEKERKVQSQKSLIPFTTLEKRLSKDPVNADSNFYASIKSDSVNPKFIAEFKRTSPTMAQKGKTKSLEDVIRVYKSSANVVAISVLTEEDHFNGTDEDLSYAVSQMQFTKPVLRKDFIMDEYQIIQSKVLGAQAYLLIASLFDQKALNALVRYGKSIGIEPLVEVHSESQLIRAINSGARCIGFNSRDLRTFTIKEEIHELAKQVDGSYARIIESGVDNPEYVTYVSGFSDAILIGTYFLNSDSIESAINRLAREGGNL